MTSEQRRARVRREAIDWAIRTHDESFNDWEGLAAWLAHDPEHPRAYDRATIAASEGASSLRAPRDVVTARPPRRTGPPARLLRYALAASVVASAGLGGWLYQSSRTPLFYQVETGPGATRVVTLGGSVRVDLNGGTRLTLDRRNARFARLDRGEAVFTVRHDPAHPFRVESGEAAVTDLGTTFAVTKDRAATRVTVAEGEVRVGTSRGVTDLPAGRSVLIQGDTVVAQPPGETDVGDWRRGRLDFSSITLADLAVRVNRSTGASIRVVPAIASQRVSGSVALERDPDATVRTISAALDLALTREGRIWVWSQRRIAPRN